ncbi:MAG: tetratricopeptide repeat protein [Opitutales bacterium]
MSRQRKKQSPIVREKSVLFGFAVQTRSADGRIRISLRWSRLFAAMAGLFVAGWLTVAAALYFYFKYSQDFDTVTYSGMVALPFRMDAHREAMGNRHVEKGLEKLNEREFREGLRLLRLGVRRAPDNLEGRAVLGAIFEQSLNSPEASAELMLKGLEHGGSEDQDYLKQTIRLLLRHQMDDKIRDMAATYLPEDPEPTRRNAILALGAANAGYARGHFDEAEDYINAYELEQALEGMLLSSKISWERGNRKEAISKLEQSLGRFPERGALLMQLTRYHREIGNNDEARRYAILRSVDDPLSHAPRIELLHIYEASGATERKQRETRRILRQFRNDASALEALANFAASTGDIALARRTYEQALGKEFDLDTFALLLIEAHIKAEDYQGALAFAEELREEQPRWLNRRKVIFNSLRAVASYGAGDPDLGEIYLQDFLNNAGDNPNIFLPVAQHFIGIDRKAQARKVLMAGHKRNPKNQRLLTELVRTELALGNTSELNSLLNRLLQMRRPETELLAEAYQKLGSDRFIFTLDRKALLAKLNSALRENNTDLPSIDS